MTPTLRGMTVPVIKSLCHLSRKRRDVIWEEKKFTSANDSEALMTADKYTIVWTTTKQDFDSAALGLKTNPNYLAVNWQIIKQSIIDVVIPANPSQKNRE